MTAVGMVHAISVNVTASMDMKASIVPKVSIFSDFLLLFFLTLWRRIFSNFGTPCI
jgi:hypothetical protein